MQLRRTSSFILEKNIILAVEKNFFVNTREKDSFVLVPSLESKTKNYNLVFVCVCFIFLSIAKEEIYIGGNQYLSENIKTFA